MKRSFLSLMGFAVQAQDGAAGTVEDFYFDDSSWVLRYWVVRPTGGRSILIAPAAIDRIPDWLFHQFAVNLTLEEIANAPAINLDEPITRREEENLASFYRWPAYWRAGGVWRSSRGEVLALPKARNCADVDVTNDEPRRPDDWEAYCLRRFHEVENWHVLAAGDDAGPIEDMILETDDWSIAYLALGPMVTRHSQVLIPPAAIETVDWNRHHVLARLTRSQVETAPAYEPSLAWTPDLEARYVRFYNDY